MLRRPWLADDPEQLLDERGGQLMRAAIALTGDRDAAEDLLQVGLGRLLRNWRRISTPTRGLTASHALQLGR